MNTETILYFLRGVSFRLSGGNASCPFCSEASSRVVDSKWGVTELRECASCHLLYRAPTDSAGAGERFYRKAYERLVSGEAVELPEPDELERLRRDGFRRFGRSYDRHIALLKCLRLEPGASILDFGASWGYGVYQFREAGFRAAGFDLSPRRVEYGRTHLGVEMLDGMDDAEGRFDVFFSSHVLEHLSGIREVLNMARRVTKPGGWFVAVTPNGSDAFRAAAPAAFHRSWGLVHPVLLQERFVRRAFAGEPLFIASDPVPEPALRAWDRRGRVTDDVSGWELFFAVRLGSKSNPERPPTL